MNKKQAIIDALRAFASQRPGMEPGNYASAASYRSEARQIQRDLQDARQLLRQVELSDSITADMLLSHDVGARLAIITDGPYNEGRYGARVTYCTGQYFAVEFRRAVCRLLAGVLWNWARDHCMPKGTPLIGPNEGQHAYDGKSAGDWLRAHFKQQFGRRIASRYFD